ncbi:MAG: type VII secretion protein EccB [Mycobacterium sp.]|nr:type VII secretion protein EccB [Mycobacterium sp.]
MARQLTTKVQLSGYRLGVRRIEQGVTRRDTSLTTSPFSPQTIAFSVGIFLAAMIVAVGALLSVFAPRADRNGASIVLTKSGGKYVMFDQKLHPVTNLASARLIVNKADIPKVVKDDTLAGQPRGQLMGIPSAPDNLAQRTDDTAEWTVCDKHTGTSDLSLTKTDALSTTLIAGTGARTDAVAPLRRNDAILVKLDSAPNELWMIYKGQRTLIGPNDLATRSALGVAPAQTTHAIPISLGLFNAIPAAPALTTPYIPDRNQVNPGLPSVRNGDVILTSNAAGDRQYRVALPAGVQPIPEFVAQLLINTGSKQVTTIDPSELANQPLANDINVANYPDQQPVFRQPNVLCWSWTKGARDQRATETIFTGEGLPIAPNNVDNVVTFLKSTPPTATADASFTTPGRGWFVRVTGPAPDSHAAEQLIYIDDTGVRYFIGPDNQGKYDDVVKALGLGSRDPLPIPWSVAKLYAPGSTLSRQAALTEHEFLPDDLHQKDMAPNPDRNAAPPG